MSASVQLSLINACTSEIGVIELFLTQTLSSAMMTRNIGRNSQVLVSTIHLTLSPAKLTLAEHLLDPTTTSAV